MSDLFSESFEASSLKAGVQGLRGEYYSNLDFTGKSKVRIDPQINFNWFRAGSGTGVGPETFSVRWTGQVKPKHTESYTFCTQADDGVRLWIDGKQLINDWVEHAVKERCGSIDLSSDKKYDLKLEYYDATQIAVVKLFWQSPSQNKEIVPTGSLFRPSTEGDPIPPASGDNPPANPSAVNVYVATAGNDSNSGTDPQSPFRTLERARDFVRGKTGSMAGNIVVHIGGGTYLLANTLTFDTRDSGKNGHNVIYKAQSGQSVQISSAERITGWNQVGSSGVWKASAGELRFRQIYVNGKPGIRARTPNAGSFYRLKDWNDTNKTLRITASHISAWQRPEQVEMVVLKHWNQTRFHIASHTVADGFATLKPRASESAVEFEYLFPKRELNQAYYWENAYEFLDSPGEWYLNETTNEVFYKPRAGEDMSNAVVEVPRLNKLVTVKGTKADPVHNLQFIGLTFEQAKWNQPTTVGFVGAQAVGHKTADGFDIVPAAVDVSHARNIRFERNTFRRLGTSGLYFLDGIKDSQIIGNRFYDISGTGIGVDPVSTSFGAGDANKRGEAILNIAVRNNIITRAGLDYTGSVGIFVGYSTNGLIEHNLIYNLPYTGINVGWGFSYTPTSLKNNMVRHNHIHHVMQLHDDGGGIYTQSFQPGTMVVKNYIHDITRSQSADHFPIAGVYLDACSKSITVKNNAIGVTENRGITLFKTYQQKHCPAIENTVTDNAALPQEIIDAAGLETSFRDLSIP